LAEISRPLASSGERAAAELLGRALAERGARVRIEAERVHGTYWVPIGLCSAAAALAGLAGRWATAVGLATAVSIADDLEIGRRPLRRALIQRMAHNVVGEFAPLDSDGRTLVIHAHHDAARTGIVFHPGVAMLAVRVAGGLIERVGATPAPMWAAVHGPAAVCLGGLLGWRWLRRAGAMMSAVFAGAMANIAFSAPSRRPTTTCLESPFCWNSPRRGRGGRRDGCGSSCSAPAPKSRSWRRWCGSVNGTSTSYRASRRSFCASKASGRRS
jgi:hypothetical protein